MNIMEIGKYELTQDFTFQPNVISITTLTKGTVIEITQVDVDCHKVFGPKLGDWQFWNLPVKKL